jgi:hypothetical protein
MNINQKGPPMKRTEHAPNGTRVRTGLVGMLSAFLNVKGTRAPAAGAGTGVSITACGKLSAAGCEITPEAQQTGSGRHRVGTKVKTASTSLNLGRSPGVNDRDARDRGGRRVAGPALRGAGDGRAVRSLAKMARAAGATTVITTLMLICLGTGSALAAPEPPTLELTAKTATEASLRATVTPAVVLEGDTYEFLYKKSPTDCKAGSHSASGLIVSEEILETLTALEPGATYTACLQVENATHEKAESPPVTFTLLAEAPLTSTPARSIHPTTAVLEGTLNPLATGKAGWHFAYSNPGGSSCTEGPTTAQEGEVEGKSLPEHKEVTGLEPGQEYTFCLVATNELGEATAGNEVSFTTEALAPVITGEYPSEIEPTTATLNASIDPGGAETTYHFEYLTQAQFEADGSTFGAGAEKTPESASIGADNTEHPAVASLEKLHPGTTYHYRAVATNPQSPPGGTPGPDATFATPALPTSTTAETCPNAQRRSEQPYASDLPDCRAYEMVSPLDKEDNSVMEIGADASAPNAGEEPAIEYDSQGSFADPAATPYRDAYISRRGADGWSTQNISPPFQPSKTITTFPFDESFFTPNLSQGLLASQDYPLTSGSPGGYQYLYVADTGEGASASSAGSYKLVSTVNPPQEEPYEGNLESGPHLFAQGASTDLSHVVFDESGALTPGAPAYPARNVYEWAQGTGELSLVNVPPEGKSFEGSGGANVGATTGEGAPAREDLWHAVSANGSRVFFTAEEEGIFPLGQLYVRENPMSPPTDGSDCAVSGDACTIEVSASQKTNGTGPKGTDPNGYCSFGGATGSGCTITPGGTPRQARYWGANAEGSKVFFSSYAELTNEAYTGPEDNEPNLYEYNVETKQLTDLTIDTEGDGAALLGLVTASEDGSYVYFVAEGKLAQGATPGQPNLYLYHAGRTSFIATLAAATEQAGTRDGTERGGDSMDWQGDEMESVYPEPDVGPGSHAVRVTPDGTRLAFGSELSLTGYDNERATAGQCESQGQTGRCKEIFLYDAEADGGAGSVICASCDPSGARPVGEALFSQEERAELSLHQPRNLSANGDRLFFQSPDALVPHDSDGASGCPRVDGAYVCQDVYEWELPASAAEATAGANSCTSSSPDFSAVNGGCTFPISDVAGDHEAFFLDADPSGGNVFIATADQLVPSDLDQKVDVYDVRVGGGFPVTPAPPVCANADSCKSPETPQPGVFGAPASATFAGPGNPSPAPPPPPAVVKPKPKPKTCKKGDVKNKKGKCIRKKHKKSKKAKKSAKGRK